MDYEKIEEGKYYHVSLKDNIPVIEGIVLCKYKLEGYRTLFRVEWVEKLTYHTILHSGRFIRKASKSELILEVL